MAQVGDCLAVSFLTTSFSFMFSFIFRYSCYTLPTARSPSGCSSGEQQLGYEDGYVQGTCDSNSYSQMFTLYLAPAETAILSLFHSPQDFDASVLVPFVFTYFFLACLACGIMVPSGLFVPTLLIGAGMGRLIGQFFKVVMGVNAVVDPGTYALIGAASFMGGVSRSVVALCVMLVEATGNIQYGLPMMLTLMTAKFVGDLVSPSIYDIQIAAKRWAFLEPHAPDAAASLQAFQIMNPNVQCIKEVMKVGDIHKMLVENADANAFPVVAFEESIPPTHTPPGSPLHPTSLFPNETVVYDMPKSDIESEIKPQQQQPLHPPPLPPPQPFITTYPTSIPPIEFLPSPVGVVQGSSETKVGHRTPLLKTRELQSDQIELDDSVSQTESSQIGGTNELMEQGPPAPPPAPPTPPPPDTVNPTPTVEPQQLQRYATYWQPTNDESRLGAETSTHGSFRGLILRKHLMVILKYKAFLDKPPKPGTQPPLLDWFTFEKGYPRYPTMDQLFLSDNDKQKYIDVTPYMHRSPLTVFWFSPVTQVYNIFRTLGLRHLVVLNAAQQVVGIITRKSLTEDFMEKIAIKEWH